MDEFTDCITSIRARLDCMLAYNTKDCRREHYREAMKDLDTLTRVFLNIEHGKAAQKLNKTDTSEAPPKPVVVCANSLRNVVADLEKRILSSKPVNNMDNIYYWLDALDTSIDGWTYANDMQTGQDQVNPWLDIVREIAIRLDCLSNLEVVSDAVAVEIFGNAESLMSLYTDIPKTPKKDEK